MRLQKTLLACALSLGAAQAQAATFYVDANYTGSVSDGSSARPWKSLRELFNNGLIQTKRWNALPYNSSSFLVPANPNAPVKSGDTILVKNGSYGALNIQSYYNDSDIVIAAAPGHHPKLRNIFIRSSGGWVIRGFAVSPSYETSAFSGTIVTAEGHSWHGPSYKVSFDNLDIKSVADARNWTAAQWIAAPSGVNLSGKNMSLKSSQIRNVRFGISANGQYMTVRSNLVDGFSADGMRGLANDASYSYNRVQNAFVGSEHGDSNHDDGFQSWSVGSDGKVGTGSVKNVVLQGNVFIGRTDPNQPLMTDTFQGIGCFDGMYDNWTVTNNTIIVDHYHGLSFYGLRNSSIFSNRVFDTDSTNDMTPWIMVHHHKRASNDPSAKAWSYNNQVRYNAAPNYVFQAAEAVSASDNETL